MACAAIAKRGVGGVRRLGVRGVDRVHDAHAGLGEGHQQLAQKMLRERVYNRSDDEDDIPTELPGRTEQIIDNNPEWFARRRRASA